MMKICRETIVKGWFCTVVTQATRVRVKNSFWSTTSSKKSSIIYAHLFKPQEIWHEHHYSKYQLTYIGPNEAQTACKKSIEWAQADRRCIISSTISYWVIFAIKLRWRGSFMKNALRGSFYLLGDCPVQTVHDMIKTVYRDSSESISPTNNTRLRPVPTCVLLLPRRIKSSYAASKTIHAE